MEKIGKSDEPKLAPPGAGIPLPARIFLQLVVNPFVAGREDREKMRKRFNRLHEKIREVYLSIPEKERERKVLVPPQRGLEDSSRYWSAAMVLEHLEIVGRAIGEAVVNLSNGKMPVGKADTARVKPQGKQSSESILASFESFRSEFIPGLESRIVDFNSKTLAPHPWFGKLTARKWYWVLGMHAGIHLEQIEAIRRLM